MNRILEKWIKFLERQSLLVILITFLLAGLSLPSMIHLFKAISSDPVDLLPENYPSVQSLLKIREKIEPKTQFDLLIESDNPENTKRLIEDLKKILIQNPLVGRVYNQKPGYHFFDQHKLLFLDLEDLKTIRDRIDKKIKTSKLGSLYIDFEEDNSKDLDFKDIEKKYRREADQGAKSEYYVSPNGKTFGLFVESKKSNLSIAETANFQDGIRNTVKQIDLKSYDPTLKIYFDGSAKVLEYRSLMKDLSSAGILAAILIFLPLLIRFRKPQFILLIFLPIVLGIPIGFGLTSFEITKLNVTTSFLFAILGGLGVETGIHLFSRYYQKRSEGSVQEEALRDIYLFYGPAVFTSVASLAVTFLLMLFSDFRGFSEFGLIAGVGLLVVFCLYFSFFPALLVFAEKIRFLKIKNAVSENLSSTRSLFSPSPILLKSALIFFSLITLFSIVVTPLIQFEYDSKKVRSENNLSKISKEKRREVTGGRVNNPAVVLINSPQEAEAIGQYVKEKRNQNPKTTLDNVLSYYSLVPRDQNEKMKVIQEMRDLLSDPTLKLVKKDKKKDLDQFKQALNETTLIQKNEVPTEVEKIFIGNKMISGTLLFINAKPDLELGDGRNAIAFTNEIEKIETPQKTFYSANDSIVYANVLKTMFRDSKKVLLISLASLFFFVFLDFKSLKKTLLILFSILAGVFWVMGIMYLFNIKMNLYNMVMIPSIMGMSIDNSIHVYHSYEELGEGSLMEVLKTTGVSSLLASLTNASGFISLLICHHGGLRSMGIVSTIGLATCLITTLFFLPMILYFLERWKLKWNY